MLSQAPTRSDRDGEGKSWDELTESLGASCRSQPFASAWALTDVATGREIAQAGDRVVPAASTRKVAIMMTVLRAVSSGRLDLDREVPIDDRYRDQVFSGLLQHLSSGLTLRLQDALALMISVSDNLSTAHLVDLVGLDEVNRFCADLGMSRTSHRHALIPELPVDHDVTATNSTTPRDQNLLLFSILEGARDEMAAERLGCSRELCQVAIAILKSQLFADAMPALLPQRAVVAHKTGAGWRDVSDIGVVYDDDEPVFALSVFTDGIPAALPDGTPGGYAARQHIARFARACWDALVVDRSAQAAADARAPLS